MYTVLIVLHVIVCLFLILVVLLQAGKGGGMGIAFGGGGSQTVFGSSGAGNFLTRLTAICAFIFIGNSVLLAYLSSQHDSRRLQQIAAKKAVEKQVDEASKSKALKDVEKARQALQQNQAVTPPGTTGTGTAPTPGTAPTGSSAAPPASSVPPGPAPVAPAPAAAPTPVTPSPAP